jgi:hypothetical protein
MMYGLSYLLIDLFPFWFGWSLVVVVGYDLVVGFCHNVIVVVVESALLSKSRYSFSTCSSLHSMLCE